GARGGEGRAGAGGGGAAAPGAREDAAARLYAAVAAADDEAPAYGVYFDADVVMGQKGQEVLVWIYAVDRVARYAAGATEIRAIQVRRLDNLNMVPDLAGLTRPHLREAIALLEGLQQRL